MEATNSVPIHCRAALTPEEAASYCGIGLLTIRQYIFLADKGQSNFPFFRVGKHVHIPRVSLESWLAEQGRQHTKLMTYDKNADAIAASPIKTGRKRQSVREKIKSLG